MVAAELRVDGNAIGGLLQEIFVAAITTARSACGGCGVVEPIGALIVYTGGPGAVARCPHCDGVMIRIVQSGGHIWLDLSGVRSLELRASD